MASDVSLVLFDLVSYTSTLVPAVEKVRQSGATADISDLVVLAANVPWASKWADLPAPVLNEYVSILKGDLPYSTSGALPPGAKTTPQDMIYFVDQMCVPELIGLFIPEVEGFRPEQDMSRSGLPLFLYEQSEWIEEVFTFARQPTGPSLAYPFGEWNGLFTRQEVGDFYREVSLVKPLNDDEQMAEKVENLRSLVSAANNDARWNLLLRLR